MIIAGLFCVSLGAQALGQTDRWSRCRGANPEARIAGCTEIIARGSRETRHKRIDAYINRSGAYRAKGDLNRASADLDSAIAELDKVLRLNPNSLRTLTERALLYRQKGDLGGAIADLDKALRLNPKSARALIDRASIYHAKGDLGRAIADYTAAIAAQPKSAAAFHGRGEVYRAKGDLDSAIADYDEALRLDKNLAAAYAGRARAFRGKGNFDKALAEFDEALRLDPASASLYFDRGAIHQAKGNFDQAIADFGQAIARDPKLAAAYYNRGLAFSAKGDLDRALADFDEAVRLDPKFAEAFLSRASAYRAKDDLEHARLDLLTALRLDPRLGPAKDALDEVNRRIAESAAAPSAAPPRPAPEGAKLPDLTGHWVGFAALAIFAVAYALVMTEEVTHLRKSKPVVVAAGILWIMIAFVYSGLGLSREVENSFRHVLLEYAELLLFLLVAMTYVNALDERRVFDVLRAWLVRSGYSYRTLFWATGMLAFFMSPVADNLTTALVMCAVVMKAGAGAPRFVTLSCINVVIAANAGGAFSPFGDITTLMVWQKGIVAFEEFFRLFLPSAVNFVVPAVLIHGAIPHGAPAARDDSVPMKIGGRRIMALFILTIATAVSVHIFFHLPPVLGMMTGLGYLQLFGFYLQRVYHRRGEAPSDFAFDVFRRIERVEWDTLLFFYGVMMCVGALGVLGYLSVMSYLLYGLLGATAANVLIGVLSAILDNTPLMFSVLTIQPDMSLGQWLLITLTAGVGGSLLSIGSAAGVALMGRARGIYTFAAHLRWTPAIAAGYAASVVAHITLNRSIF